MTIEEGVFLDNENSFLADFGRVVIGNERRSDLVKKMKDERVVCNQNTRKFVFRNREAGQEIGLTMFRVGDLMTEDEGKTLKDVVTKAKSIGLELCPRETAVSVALEKGKELKGPIGVLSKKGNGMGFVNVDYFGGEVEITYLKDFGSDRGLEPTEELVMMRDKKEDFVKFVGSGRVTFSSPFVKVENAEAFGNLTNW